MPEPLVAQVELDRFYTPVAGLTKSHVHPYRFVD